MNYEPNQPITAAEVSMGVMILALGILMAVKIFGHLV